MTNHPRLLGSLMMITLMNGSALLASGCSGPTLADAALPDAPSADVRALDAPALDTGDIDAGGTDSAVGDAGIDAPLVCPPLSGTWSSMIVSCATAVVPTQVTVDLDAACAATLTSIAPKGFPPVNGMATLDATGSFGPTDLMIGDETLSCTGSLDASATPLSYEIVCVGGCTITMTLEP